MRMNEALETKIPGSYKYKNATVKLICEHTNKMKKNSGLCSRSDNKTWGEQET